MRAGLNFAGCASIRGPAVPQMPRLPRLNSRLKPDPGMPAGEEEGNTMPNLPQIIPQKSRMLTHLLTLGEATGARQKCDDNDPPFDCNELQTFKSS